MKRMVKDIVTDTPKRKASTRKAGREEAMNDGIIPALTMDTTKVLLYVAFIGLSVAWKIWQAKRSRLTQVIGVLVLFGAIVALPGTVWGLF